MIVAHHGTLQRFQGNHQESVELVSYDLCFPVQEMKSKAICSNFIAIIWEMAKTEKFATKIVEIVLLLHKSLLHKLHKSFLRFLNNDLEQLSWMNYDNSKGKLGTGHLL